MKNKHNFPPTDLTRTVLAPAGKTLRLFRRMSILFCVSWLMTACFPFPGLEGKAPRVEQVLPRETLSPSVSIEITFSRSMDKSSLDGALRFSGEEKLIQGSIEWPAPEKLVFTPAGVVAPEEYLLNISTLARSAEGVPMAAPFSRTFLTGEDTDPPELLESSPDFSAVRVIPAPLELGFTFSEEIDRQSFYRAFSLSPDIGGSFAWRSENREVIFTSPYQPTADTIFRLDLTRECTDLNGLPLKEAHTRFFTLVAPPKPLLERIVFHSDFGNRTETVEEASVFSFNRDESVELFFDHLPENTEAEYYLSFQPNLDFQTAMNENSGGIMVIFEEAPATQGEYLLTAWGSEVILCCDGIRSVAPELIGVAFCPDTTSEPVDFQRIYPNDMIFPEDSESACLEIVFAHSPEATLSPLRIMENLSLSFTNGSALFSPLSLVIADTPLCVDLASMEPGTTVHYFFSVSPQDLPGLMNLELSAEFEDSLGNHPAESIHVSYNL